MTVSKIVTSAVMALSLVGVSTAAQAAPAANALSLSAPVRAGAKVGGQNNLAGGGQGIIIGLLAAAAVIAGIIIATKNDNSPTSR